MQEWYYRPYALDELPPEIDYERLVATIQVNNLDTAAIADLAELVRQLDRHVLNNYPDDDRLKRLVTALETSVHAIWL